MCGSGWVANKDRGLLLKFGLGPAFVAALSLPGLNAFELLLTQRSFKPSVEAEEYVANQVQVLKEKGPDGEQVIEDLEAWVKASTPPAGCPTSGWRRRSRASRSSARSSATAVAAKSPTPTSSRTWRRNSAKPKV